MKFPVPFLFFVIDNTVTTLMRRSTCSTHEFYPDEMTSFASWPYLTKPEPSLPSGRTWLSRGCLGCGCQWDRWCQDLHHLEECQTVPLDDHHWFGLAFCAAFRVIFGCQMLSFIYEEFSPRTWVLLNIISAQATWSEISVAAECEYSLWLVLSSASICL